VAKRTRSAKRKGQKRDVVVGVDIGGTKIALMATEIKTGKELARDRYSTPADAGPEALIERISDSITDLVDESDCSIEQDRALGIAIAGLVDHAEGQVIIAGNLAGWKDVPLRRILTRRFEIPAWVEHDANAAAHGEQ
jgi:glucokinase